MTKLPVSWEEGHVASCSSICTFRISSQCFCHFTFPTHSQHHLVCTFKTSSFLSQFTIQLGKAGAPRLPCFIIFNVTICPDTHTCTFLFFFPVFSFFLPRQLYLSSQVLLWHLRHDPLSLLLQNSCCLVPWSLTPWQGQSLGLSNSLFPSLFFVQNVADKTLLLSNHLAYLVATWSLLHHLPLLSRSSGWIPNFSRPEVTLVKGHKPVPPCTSPCLKFL